MTLALWLTFAALGAEPLTLTGSAYAGEAARDGKWSAPLYAVKLSIEPTANGERLHGESFDPKGQRFLEQTTEIEAGTPKAYRFSNLAAKQSGSLTVKQNEITMELTEDGKTRTATVSRPKVFTIGPAMPRFISQHLAELTAGKTVALDVFVLAKLDSYAVQVSKAPDPSDDPLPEVRAGTWLRLRTVPQNVLIRAFAPSVSTVVDAKTGRLICVTGPLPTAVPGDSPLKLATIRYDAETPAAAP